MLRLLQPAWLNTTITLYLTVLVFLLYIGFYWTALVWYIVGASMVEDEEHEVEADEEEILDEDLELIDIIITKHPRKKDQIHLSDFFPFLQIFDNRLVESFVEPDFTLDEDVDSLYTEVNDIIKEQLFKAKVSKIKLSVEIMDEQDKLKAELEDCEIQLEQEEDK